jgi:glycosyltransferase involved in cell wall biosynthesis
MKKTRVLVDGHVFDGEYQGTRTYLKEIYRLLIAKHYQEIEFFITSYNPNNVLEDLEGLEGKYNLIVLKLPLRMLRLQLEIPYWLWKLDIKVSHYQYIVPFLKKGLFVVTIHDILFNDFPQYFTAKYRILRNLLFGYATKVSDYVVTVSQYSALQIANRYSVSKNKILITPNGASEIFYNAPPKKTSIQYIQLKYGFQNYILYVSRIEPRKNQKLMLHIWEQLHREFPTCHLVLVGKQSIEGEQFMTKLQSLSIDIKHTVHYIEQIPQSDLVHLYNAAMLFVYPSLAEGFGIPPIEAAACQTPVVCAANTAMLEFDFFGSNLVDANNLSLFVNQVVDTLNGNIPYNLSEIQAIVREKYSWQKSAEVFKNLFLKV